MKEYTLYINAPGTNTPVQTKNLSIYVGNAHLIKNEGSFKHDLSDFEQSRSELFVRNSDSKTYICTHYFLRELLSKKTGVLTNEIDIHFEENKKPFLKSHTIDFNISHSHSYFSIGIVDDEKMMIGVDIEMVEKKDMLDDVVINYMHEQEQEYILGFKIGGDDKLIRFLEIWTKKEALLKILGTGISDDIKKMNVLDGVRKIDAGLLGKYRYDIEQIFIQTFVKKAYVVSIALNQHRNLQLVNINEFK